MIPVHDETLSRQDADVNQQTRLDSNEGEMGSEPTAWPLGYGSLASREGFEPPTTRLVLVARDLNPLEPRSQPTAARSAVELSARRNYEPVVLSGRSNPR